MDAQYALINGRIVDTQNARVSILTHAMSYGTGCFEGIRGYWNSAAEQLFLFRTREHFERLGRSCKILHMSLSTPVDQLMEEVVELVRQNDWRQNIYVRVMAYKADETIGCKLHGLQDHYYMVAVPMGDYSPTTGMSACVSSWRRIDDNVIPARAKVSGGYLNSALAKTEANERGFDEAIVLTGGGTVSEGSAQNIFLVLDGSLHTPATTESILPGITRATVMELARKECDRMTFERRIGRTELYVADEVFMTGTGAQVAPVVSIDRQPIGTGAVGPLSARLQELYIDVVYGRDPRYARWLTPVYASPERSVAAPRGRKQSSREH